MNIVILAQLVEWIESILKHHGPEVVKAVGQAAADAAIQSAQQSTVEDPKVAAVTAASLALLKASQNLKTAINTPQ